MDARIAIEPLEMKAAVKGNAEAAKRRRELFEEAIVDAGGRVIPVEQANGLVWSEIGDGTPLLKLLDANPKIEWVQLPWAGVENFATADVFERPIKFTCAKAAFGRQVGEHAFLLTLASLRNIVRQSRSAEWCQIDPVGLDGKRVTILGAGGIAEGFVRYLVGAECEITVLRRSEESFPRATRTLSISALYSVLPNTDVLVIALSLTPATRGLIGEHELSLLPSDAVFVNVARGAIVDTDALVAALSQGRLAAAALDVTEPEPLPTGHPLWSMDNVLITSHSADSVEWCTRQLVVRVRENVLRFRKGEGLLGEVDPNAGY